jgi:hypothetical protein
MCKYNIHCQELICHCHKRLSAFKLVSTALPSPPLTGTLPVLQLIQHQTELIKTISQQSVDFMAVLAQVSTKLDYFARLPTTPEFQISDSHVGSDEASTEQDILQLIAGERTNFLYALKLLTPLPQPAYKERAFSLTAEVIDHTGTRVSGVAFSCKLLLFSCEQPAKLLRTNTSGDKVMHGSVEASVTDGLCQFPNIVIKEVTSHFKNGVFFLAITSSDAQVRPLILSNLVVKARRVNADSKPRKRPRPGQSA